MLKGTVTLTITGQASDIREALLELLGGRLPDGLGFIIKDDEPSTAHFNYDGSDAERIPDGSPRGWTQTEIAQFWSAITPNARAILAEVAQKPQGYPADLLSATLGIEGKIIGSRLSSCGFARKRLGFTQDKKDNLYEWKLDKGVYYYTMRPGIAMQVLALAQEQHEER